jgi:hypothetical protein
MEHLLYKRALQTVYHGSNASSFKKKYYRPLSVILKSFNIRAISNPARFTAILKKYCLTKNRGLAVSGGI